jgi:hypothetical protein
MPDDTAPENSFFGSDRIELVSTIVLAIATILTAWSAFQSGKWSGQQSINFSEASAARTESTRADTRGGQLSQIDVAMFIDWVTAFNAEVKDGTIAFQPGDDYVPTPGTTSGFLYLRFRPEFVPAVNAWIATRPLTNPDAPPSPFAMPEYVVADRLEAVRLEAVADAKGIDARTANQNGDNYVLTMVLFASVLFFAGVSSKLIKRRNRLIALGFGIFLLLAGIVIESTYPILI